MFLFTAQTQHDKDCDAASGASTNLLCMEVVSLPRHRPSSKTPWGGAGRRKGKANSKASAVQSELQAKLLQKPSPLERLEQAPSIQALPLHTGRL